MRLLDLFCGAGGAAMGYSRAGFDEIVGVDLVKQPRYPFTFVQADALTFLEWGGADGFDVIHASPPCQGYTRLRRQARIAKSTAHYPKLVESVRAKLTEYNVLYVIENVIGAPLWSPIVLCGSQFGLKVYRHRLFESSLSLIAPLHTPHQDQTPPAGRGVSPKGFISINSGGAWNIPSGWSASQYKCMAMGIDWMTQKELTEAIPPVYTEYIGRQLLRHLQEKVA